MQQERNLFNVSELLILIQDLHDKVNSSTDARDFYALETASSSGASHVPSQPLNIPSPSGMLSRDAGLPLDSRNTMGTSGNVFESLPAREGRCSTLFENSRNFESSCCGLTSEARRDPQSSSIPTARPNQGVGTLNFLYHSGGFYSQNGVMDSAKYPISELHLGKFLDSLEFQSWKVNFKTEVCTNSVFLQITMHWIKEVEIANSMDDLMTSQSITGRREFFDEMLDAKIVFALKKLPTSVHFRRRGSVEEKRAREDDRFLRGRQIAYMIYEYFRTTWAYAIVQGLSDLFTIRLQNNDVQDFDTSCGQALLTAREILTEMVLEVWNKSKLQDLVQFQTVLAVYEQENIRNNEPPHYSSLKTLVRRHLDQTMRTRNFRARSEVLGRGAVTKSHKRRHASVERKEGECHQWKGIGHCSKRRFV